MTGQRTAYLHSPAPGNSRTYMGSILTVPVGGNSTRGWFAVVTAKTEPGNEPPPHVHEWEDEFLYLLEGRAELCCGRRRFVAGAGDAAFLPQGVAHAMTFLTPALRLIAVISVIDKRPVRLDRHFRAISASAASLSPPRVGTAETHATAADSAHATRLAAEHGCRFLTPDETRELLPGYPGFGVRRR